MLINGFGGDGRGAYPSPRAWERNVVRDVDDRPSLPRSGFCRRAPRRDARALRPRARRVPLRRKGSAGGVGARSTSRRAARPPTRAARGSYGRYGGGGGGGRAPRAPGGPGAGAPPRGAPTPPPPPPPAPRAERAH